MFNSFYFIWYKTKNIFYALLTFYIIAMLYCFIFKISFMRFFVYFIVPIFQLVANLWIIIKQLLFLPYHLYLVVKNAILNILGMFGFVVYFINNIFLFASNLTTDVI
jgi:hypothetical protein